MRKMIYTVVMTYLTYCSSLGTQFFLWYLVDKNSPLYYPFAVTYFVSLPLTMSALDRLGWYSKQLNEDIVMGSTILVIITLKYVFQPY